MYAAWSGLITCGPGQTFVLAREWLGSEPASGAGDAELLGRLAGRYLQGHGPAAAEDLAAWSGLTMGAARAGFAAIEDELSWFDTGIGPVA